MGLAAFDRYVASDAILPGVIPNTEKRIKYHVPASPAKPEFAVISPNFGVTEPMMNILLWPGGNAIAKLAQGDAYGLEPESEIQARYWAERYPTEVGGVGIATARVGRRADLGELKMPLLMFYSDEEQVVDSTKSVAAFERFGAPADAERRIQLKATTSRNPTLLARSSRRAVKAALGCSGACLSKATCRWLNSDSSPNKRCIAFISVAFLSM